MDTVLSIIRKSENRALAVDPKNRNIEYFWWKRRAEYIIRLLFAITVDMVILNHMLDPAELIPQLYQCKLGSMAYIARKLLKKLPEEERKMFEKIWTRTSNLTDGKDKRSLDDEPDDFITNLNDLVDNRNADGHIGTPPEELDQFIDNIRKCIDDLEQITEGRFFQSSKNINQKNRFTQRFVYLTSEPSISGEDEMIYCLFIEDSEEWLQSLSCRDCGLVRKRAKSEPDELQHQLYLQVLDPDKVAPSYYRLSPFIEWQDGNILLYQECLCVLDRKMKFNYILLRPENGKKSTVRDCYLNSLRPKPQEGLYKIYNVQGKKNGNFHKETMQHLRIEVRFNAPRNPGIMKSIDDYYEKICPQLENVVDICKNRWHRYLVICGEGGLGKTAMVLHIINKILEDGTLEYRRIILLSAKEVAPDYTHSTQIASEMRLEQDFVNYLEPLQKLYLLIVKNGIAKSVPVNMDERKLEQKIIRSVNSPRQDTTTLLIIDDLDSLDGEEQKKVIWLMKKFHNDNLITLITTRNGTTDGVRTNLERLSAEQSLDFLCWYLNRKQPGLGDRIRCVQDRELLKTITEGRPYDLLHWANLILRGRQPSDLDAQTFHQYLTPDQKTQYLCRTSLRQVNKDCQILFRFLCEYNTALCTQQDKQEIQRVQINLQFLEFLQLPNLKTREALDHAVQTLRDVCLLEPLTKDSSENMLEVRKGIVYDSLLKDCPKLPRYLQHIVQAAEKSPNKWQMERLTTLMKYLINVLKAPSTRTLTPIPEDGIFSMLVKNRRSLTQDVKHDVDELFQWMLNQGLSSRLGEFTGIDRSAPVMPKKSPPSENAKWLQPLRERISALPDLRGDDYSDAYANIEEEIEELLDKESLSAEQRNEVNKLFGQLIKSKPRR